MVARRDGAATHGLAEAGSLGHLPKRPQPVGKRGPGIGNYLHHLRSPTIIAGSKHHRLAQSITDKIARRLPDKPVAMQGSIGLRPGHLLPTVVGLHMTPSKQASALVWKHTGSRSPKPYPFRDDLSDDRPLALDGNPRDCFLGYFDR
jgi:hypothetical protein